MENFKKCSKCGLELPASEFWKNASTEDGLQKIYSNPELARFSPRELIAELKARGYTGELKYTQTISL